jgi:cytochrome c-type biogenesis protein CcmH
MQIMIKKIPFLILFFISVIFCTNSFAAAAHDIYYFDSPKQQNRFQHLNQQFRCLVCQNESLAESNAPLAQDLRFQVYKMVKSNKTDQEIIQFLVNRYGDFVLFRPPMSKLTYILWFGPFVMLFAALIRLYWLISQRRKKTRTQGYTFSKKDRERIRHLLSEN